MSPALVLLHFIFRGIEALQTEGNQSLDWTRVDLNEVLKLMEDLIEYFAQPKEEDGRGFKRVSSFLV